MSGLLDGYFLSVVARLGVASSVPTLAPGEIGYDTDAKTFRVGDGTPVPPRVLTDKSTGSFDLSSITQITMPGEVVVTGGLVDGVDISTLNQANGFLVRTAPGTFANAKLQSGDGTITITNGDGTGGGIVDIRINPTAILALPSGSIVDAAFAPSSIAGFKGALTPGGSVTTLTGAQAVTLLPAVTTTLSGLVPAPGSITGRIFSDSGWTAPMSLINGLLGKASVIAMSTVNINQTGLVVPIDGINLSNGTWRIGLNGQADATKNGIWSVTVSGSSWTWVRSSDASVSSAVLSGISFWASEGNTNGDTLWALATPDPIVLESTALNFVQVGGVASASLRFYAQSTVPSLPVLWSRWRNTSSLIVGGIAPNAEATFEGLSWKQVTFGTYQSTYSDTTLTENTWTAIAMASMSHYSEVDELFTASGHTITIPTTGNYEISASLSAAFSGTNAGSAVVGNLSVGLNVNSTHATSYGISAVTIPAGAFNFVAGATLSARIVPLTAGAQIFLEAVANSGATASGLTASGAMTTLKITRIS